MEQMIKQIIETWEIHHRINLYLLEAIKEDYLQEISASKGRNIGEQFAHIHNVRLMWLKASGTDFLKGQAKLEKETKLTKKMLHTALGKSSSAISRLLENSLREDKLKGFKPHPSAFLGYLISHESHHRGQIMLALKQAGHSVDQKIQYGLWEWGSR
jgi:uncharacterized damage-inducible protein DinB